MIGITKKVLEELILKKKIDNGTVVSRDLTIFDNSLYHNSSKTLAQHYKTTEFNINSKTKREANLNINNFCGIACDIPIGFKSFGECSKFLDDNAIKISLGVLFKDSPSLDRVSKRLDD